MQDIHADTLFPFEKFLSSFNHQENCSNSFCFDKIIFSVEDDNKINGKIRENEYTFNLRRNRFTDKKSIIIICCKDNALLVENCLAKMVLNEINIDHDILLVDDRSDTQSIIDLSDKFNFSYLRIDNTENVFNYSILNNIAASYAIKYNKELLIFYNNDLWPTSKQTLPSLIEKHFNSKANITGCKLVYPSKEEYEKIGKPKHLLDQIIDKIFGTIQHGGVFFTPKMSAFTDNNRTYGSPEIALAPSHLWRFYDSNHLPASLDTTCYAVTGALHIISSKDFIKLGGLNICMGIAFQDIDLCIKAIENNMLVYYVGSESMVHAESITNAKEEVTKTKDFYSDHILWEVLWSIKLPHILGYQRGFRTNNA
jgi:GT2 family glycosyltransferase